MKFMLIALNALLAAGLVYLAWASVTDPVDFASRSKTAQQAGADGKRTSSALTRTKRTPAKVVTESPELTEQKIDALLKRNIFNTERVPDAPANRSAARATQQVRADLSLVGTYVIGDSLGAIILQRLQGNAQQQLKALQQKEYEQYTASSTRVTDPKKKGETAASAASEGESVEEAAASGEENPDKRVIVMGNPSISANNVFRQHMRVGDTTVTGYKLVEVTRTSAVLTRNSERIELSLLTPSEAGNIARQRQNNNANNRNNQQNNNANNRNNQQNNNANRNNQQNNNNRNNNANRNNQQNNNNRNNNANRNNQQNNNNRNNNASRNNNNNRNNNRDDVEWF
jgi:hypothetical protein